MICKQKSTAISEEGLDKLDLRWFGIRNKNVILLQPHRAFHLSYWQYPCLFLCNIILAIYTIS